MSITLRKYAHEDLDEMRMIWNSVVEEGASFPQVEPLTAQEAEEFFGEQTYTAVAEENGEIVGLYILHPNNVGRCGHIANASYAVKADRQGNHIGEQLVRDSLAAAKALSFRILQFNAVVATNKAAVHLYEKIGFTPLGKIPGGFQLKNNTFVDIILYYIELL